MGGIVIQTEYALCEVIIPEEWNEIFQGRTECLLAFDYEVAEENPGAEFVTFGSYIFEQLLAFVEEHALSGIRFVDIESRPLLDPMKKIQRFLNNENSRIKLLNEQNATAMWAVFTFRVGYVSDEKEEEYQQVWFDLSRNEIDEEMQQQQDFIPYTEKPVVEYAACVNNPDLTTAFLSSYQHIQQSAEQGRKQRMRQDELEKEIQRISDYYDDLIEESIKRSERKGMDGEKKKEIADKISIIQKEKDKQLREINHKYTVRVEAGVDQIGRAHV